MRTRHDISTPDKHTHADTWPTHVVAFVPLPSSPLAIHLLQMQHVRSPDIGQAVCRRLLILQQSLLFLLRLRLLTYGSSSTGMSTDVSGNLLPPVSNIHKPRSFGTNEQVFISDIAATLFGCKPSSQGFRIRVKRVSRTDHISGESWCLILQGTGVRICLPWSEV